MAAVGHPRHSHGLHLSSGCALRSRPQSPQLSVAPAWSLLLLDPFWLFDPGFELSFLAVLTIAVVALPWLRLVTQPWRDGLRRLQDADWDSRCPPQIADFRIWLRFKFEALQDSARWDR
ncbi:MAG: hypothetical protein EXQ58_12915 [Acidobacteria bacterium]|nr:hypothetical protein [Acidobacteriota bacterium]